MKNGQRKKRVCVVGLGQFGSELARSLARDCEVLALDADEARVERVRDGVQLAARLDARDVAGLKSLVTPDIDEAVVSLGENLEAGILCTLHLRRIGVRAVRVRAVNEEQAEILRLVGATEVFFPERESARRTAAVILNPNLLDFVPLAEGFRVMEFAPPPDFVGRTLADLRIRKTLGTLVIAVRTRGPREWTFLPGSEYEVRADDVLVMVGREEVRAPAGAPNGTRVHAGSRP